MTRQWTLQTKKSLAAGEKGTEYSNPVFKDGTLLFGNESYGITALYPDYHQVRWRLPIPNGVTSEILVSNGFVYFTGGNGHLYCVSFENGKIEWQTDLRIPFTSKPSVRDGRVFVTTADDTVYAFDAGTGEWIWHYRRRSAGNATIKGAAQPWVHDNEVLAGLSDGYLVSLNLQDGKLKWEKKLHEGFKFTDLDAKIVSDDGLLYMPSYDGGMYALKPGAPPQVLWKFDAGGAKAVVIDDQRILLPSSNGSVYAIDKRTSKQLWQFDLDFGTPTDLVVTDRYVIFGSSYQYLYVLDKQTGKALYRYDVGRGSGFNSSPIQGKSDKDLYILSGAGNLMSFQLREEPRKSYPHGRTDPYVFFERL